MSGLTVRELQELVYLRRIIAREQDRLDDLRGAAGVKSPLISDSPRAPGIRDRIGETVPEIVDQSAVIEEKLREYREKQKGLEDYIESVPFARIRLILQLRFMDQKTWQEVADEIGGKETEYSVKQACYRYIEGNAHDQPSDGETPVC